MKLHIMQFSPSLFSPNILLSNLFSNTLSLCSSLNVRDKVSHPYKTTVKIIVLYTLNFMFFDSRHDEKNSELKGSKVVSP
jgi:polysaccharide pyruvyl transferase WcaK-like protein